MRNGFCLAAALILLPTSSCRAALGAAASTDAAVPNAALAQRDAALNNLTTGWQVQYHQQDFSLTLKHSAKFAEVPSRESYHSTTEWTFARAGACALVTGVYELINDNTTSPYSTIEHLSSYYHGDDALSVNDSTEINDHAALTEGTDAWECSGPSTHYSAPFPTGLCIMPQDFAMLTGMSPLSMYGATWRVTLKTLTTEELKTTVSNVEGTPADIAVKLSRSHGLAPSWIEISFHGSAPKSTITYKTLKFQAFDNYWLCRKVEETVNVPHQMDLEYVFTLNHTSPAVPIKTFKYVGQVQDFRLLGPKCSMLSLTPDQKRSVASYQWPGYFPTLSKTKQILHEQLPG